MNDALWMLLKSVDTPTVCNAIEVAEGRRGFDRFTREAMMISAPAGIVVGRARTAKIAAAKPSGEPVEEVRARRMAYYRYMAEASLPAVAVIEDIDDAPIGAYWGEINATVHKGFGLSGALTNGLMRDLGDLPEGFPILAGSVGPSHAFVHVREIDTPVTIHGLKVEAGDMIHADRHGALAIPEELLDGIGAAIAKLVETEKIVLDAARAPGFDFASFEAAWTAFEKARA